MSMLDMLSMLVNMAGNQPYGNQCGGKGWGKGGKGQGGWGGGNAGWGGGNASWDGGWGGEDWGKKRKAEEMDERARDAKTERRGLFSLISLPLDSKLAAEGYMLEGAAALYEKENGAYSSATYAMKKVTTDIYKEIEVIDLTWDEGEGIKYPEVVKAVAAAGFKHESVCIALCPNHLRWGVGVGGKIKERKNAAMLSLAIAVAVGSGELPDLVRKLPDVAHFCAAEGAYAHPQGRRWKLGGEGMEEPEPPVNDDGKTITPGCYPVVGINVDKNPAWMAGLPKTAPAVYFDKAFGDAFSCSAWILEEVIGKDVETTMEHDENMVDKFPEVMQAVKAAGGDENSFAVITAPSLKKWAVGLAHGIKNRERAAKLALAFACCTDQKQLVKFAGQYDGFGFLCSAAGMLSPELSSSRARHREGGW
eukprot:TRINITY_DN19653_c0_g1_i1.p1 TRINITY_DN19653_c0_g1~~TRINITY_DN19653_c0_g1_i1.p1  ORF type:complete len:420 (+),score=105.80 TRINITY_DN19653_c0_g1_i1:79-1338(+)